MTLEQCRLIDGTQRKFRSMGVVPPRCGELAVQLGIITRALVGKILDRVRDCRAQTEVPDDPLEGARKPALGRPRLRRRAVWGVVVLVLLCLAWYFTEDYSFLAETGTLLGILWLATEAIFPYGFTGPIALHRGFRWMAFAVTPLTITYCFYIAYQAYVCVHPAPGSEPIDSAAALWRRFYASASLLACCGVYFALVAVLRRLEIWVLENRMDLLRQVVERAHGWLRDDPADRSEGPASAREVGDELLCTAARAMRLNAWDLVLSRLLRFKGPFGAPSVWYLEPNADGKTFDVVSVAVPGAPVEVLEAFETIKREFHPVRLQETSYRDAINDCTHGDKFNRDEFLRRRNDENFISLTGFVFATAHGYPNERVDRCLAFDHRYMGSLEHAHVPKSARRWLELASFAAYPVFGASTTTDSPPIGVLIGFKNLPYGITPEDQSLLVTASRLLGLVLTSKTTGDTKCPTSTQTVQPSLPT